MLDMSCASLAFYYHDYLGSGRPNSSRSSATDRPAASSFCSVVSTGGGVGTGAGSGVLPAASQAVNRAKSLFAGSGGMKAPLERRLMLVPVVS